MAGVYGNKPNNYWRTYVEYVISDNLETVSITAILYVYWLKNHDHNSENDRPCYFAATGQATQNYYPTWDKQKSAGGTQTVGTVTYTYNKGTSNEYKELIGSIKKKYGATGTSTAVVGFTVPARMSYDVKLKSDNVSGASDWVATKKYYNYNLTLPTGNPTKTGYTFKGWTTTVGGTVVNYYPGGTYTTNNALTLYPVWQPNNPPTLDELPNIVNTPDGKLVKNFSSVKVTVEDIHIHTGRALSSIVFAVGNQSVSRTTEGDLTINLNASGTFKPTITITDKQNGNDVCTTRYELPPITVENPKWKATVEETVQPVPNIDRNGNAIITLEKYNFNTSSWEVSSESVPVTVTQSGWQFTTTLEEKNVPSASRTTQNITVNNVVRLSYLHTESTDTEAREVFFSSTRNANYSNGISNTVFIGGCRNTKYASRVWWSYINNPLYFPDTNYVEVGSNDTAVMGLCKIGDYLGVVKQSKTTDTAIFLLYPTSFDEDTTYAVKQGVSGVGAVSKYSFNILGDETLFLSPQGVMAIVPSEDEEHKVQNRSFFVDGKLLEEDGLENSYSFVYDGKYFLATGDSCYVLDGNQKNSWGNDKTNLVYEAYYLDNIPASCFMKHEDGLWFSNANNLCRFKTDREPDAYVDDYDINTDETHVNVKGEWSTILDDDSTLNYYKTMQKKGNVVSIFPIDYEWQQGDTNVVNTSAKVYIKKDAEEPEYICEINGTVEPTGDIPNELHLRKKIKKYKRLQFIVRNEKNECFGVDSIMKTYALGNFAKR